MVPVLLLLLSAPVLAQVWTPELQMKVRTVGDVMPTPDGRGAVWAETQAVMETEKSEQVSQVFFRRSDVAKPVQLTFHEKGASAPVISPDGNWIYFRSARSGKPNLYRLHVDGGEARPLTEWKGSLGGYRVSPDGKWIAFAGREEDAEIEKAKKEKRDFRVIDESPENHALWVLASDGSGKPRRLETPGHVTDFSWSADSRSVAFAHQPTAIADDWPRQDISEADAESGKVRALVAGAAAESAPHYSPDGRWVAYVTSTPRWAGEDRIAILPRGGGESRALPASFDEKVTLLGWSPDSTRVYFWEARGTRAAIYAMPVDGPPEVVFEAKDKMFGGARLNAAGTVFGLTAEASAEAPEAFVATPGEKEPRRMSEANVALLKPPVGKTEVVRWKSKDGLEIEGLLTYPAGVENPSKAPLVLVIHGGPAGVFSETYLGRPSIYPYASFSAKGWAVLRCNPRGSSGYGKKFRFANFSDWGGGDYQDLMAGVDHAIAKGVADPERLAVMGWSYGGFMTSWVIGQTTRFKAAAVGAAVTNLWSFTGTADIPGFLPDYFKGEPWQVFENFRKHSPLTYAGNVSTPALILHGEADVRVPVSQGYEYYNALKRRGVPSKMVVYPRTPHGPQEPKFVLDIAQRHLDWVEKYVR